MARDDAARLAGSALFDAEWYAATSGCDPLPLRAAGHYLRRGARRGLSPHPLFDPACATARSPRLADAPNPLLAYLDQRLFAVRTHPLFDVQAYLRAHPEAAEQTDGPIGHYLEVGAPAGWAPNTWYQPGEHEPRGLVDWLVARHDEWRHRRSDAPRARTPRPPESAERRFASRYGDVPLAASQAGVGSPGLSVPRVSVVVEALNDVDALTASLGSLTRQTFDGFEVIVVSSGSIPQLPATVARALPASRIRFVQAGEGHPATGLNLALEQAAGEFIAWMSPGEEWRPGRLRLLLSVCLGEGVPIAYDSLLVRSKGGEVFCGGGPAAASAPRSRVGVDLSRMLVSAAALFDVGCFDPSMLGAWTTDLSFRLMRAHDARPVPVLGVIRDAERARRARRRPKALRPFPEHPLVPTWTDVALNRHGIDWARLEERASRPDLVSVIVPTYGDWRLTTACVRSLHAASVPDGMAVEVLVWDNGSDATTSQVLDSLEVRFSGVRVLHTPTNLGFALGNNFALQDARGDTVVFLNNDTKVDAGWLAPLLEQLARPDVLGAQPLLLYPTGTVQSAGVAFPSCGGVPYNFLQGFPSEDARGVEELPMSALTGAALALRFRDVVALRGFDPLFRNGMEDVDLCLRLKELVGRGTFRVASRSRVTHYESQTPGRFERSVANRHLFLDRWSHTSPRDDERLWSQCGFEVLDRVIRNAVSTDRRVCVPEPVLRRRRTTVTERPPRLRWALKTAAPAGELAEGWGDTHFTRRLAAALRELGQEVVIDHCGEFSRRSGHLDDVALVLRGLQPFHPEFGQVSLAWVISHPELVSYREAAAYDRVFAASYSWSSTMASLWGLRIDPLLQATDPDLFYPDRAEADAGHPVLFVGGSRRRYRTIVRDCVSLGLPLAVYGSDWESFIPSDLIKGRHVPNAEVGALYAAAGVVLNDHWDDMREQGFISNRLFDAAASGARVITDDVVGLDGLFGSSVQVARGVGDLARLTGLAELDMVFGGVEERRATASRIHRDHSFMMRAQHLLDAALEVRSAQGIHRSR